MAKNKISKYLLSFLYRYEILFQGFFLTHKAIVKLGEIVVQSLIFKQITKPRYHTSANQVTSNSIIFLIPNLGSGGSERQIVNLVNYLSLENRTKKNGFEEIILVCFDCSKPPYNFYIDKLDSSVTVIDLKKFLTLKNFVKSILKYPEYFWLGKRIAYFDQVMTLIKLKNPRVINGWLDDPAILVGLAAVSNRIPKIILSNRNLNPTNFLTYKFYMKSAYSALSTFQNVKLINNSKVGAESYEKWLKFSPNTIKVIANGYPLEEFQTVKKFDIQYQTKSKIIIGSVVRFSREKDINLWIKTALELSKLNSNVNFKLYGDGPAKAALLKKIQNKGLSHILSINSSTKKIYEVMRDFDIFLLTSKYEGLPNVLIEAQLLGIPVVATNVGGSAETFMPGETGFIITHRRPTEIANQINILIKDLDRHTDFSIKASIYAEKRFDIRLIGKQYTELFNTI